MTTDVPNPQLELHIINAGIGESIIIHMPNDQWGVVDCYASSVADPAKNPTLQFLLARQVSKLEFLCLTHPHHDHYRGMSHLLNRFPTKYFWRFAAMSPEHLLNLLKGDALERGDDDDLESANDLQTTLRIVDQMRQRKTLSLKRMVGIQHLYRLPVTSTESGSSCDVDILSVAPSANHVERYEESLRRCFTADGRLSPDVPPLQHNDVSAALLIRFGGTRIILGGDVEASNWRDTLSESTLAHADLAAHAVKVSHHGSTNGYTQNLWAVFSASGEPFAVITPYRKHRLPKCEAVEHIRNHTSRLMTTCRSAIPFAATPNFDVWETYALEVRFALIGEFRSFQAKRASDLGICSLSFDNCGNCISIDCDGAAGALEI